MTPDTRRMKRPGLLAGDPSSTNERSPDAYFVGIQLTVITGFTADDVAPDVVHDCSGWGVGAGLRPEPGSSSACPDG